MGRLARTGVLVGACILAAGCATKYGGPTAAGGFKDSPVNERLVKVSFTGNGYVTSEKIQTYALYRCAELAREAKKPYFVLYDSLTAAARDLPSEQPRVGTLGGKPGAMAFIVLHDEARRGAQETSAVLERLRPQVETDIAGTPPK
jgi:hypothetical protein